MSSDDSIRGTGVHRQHGILKTVRQAQKTGGEEPHLSPMEGSVLQRCLLVASLLAQFKFVKIRKHYEAGLLNIPDSLPVSLDELDCLCSYLLPVWGTGHGIKGKVESAQEKLGSLVKGSRCKFVFEGTNFIPKSFKEWNHFIFQLASHGYWENNVLPFMDDLIHELEKEKVCANSSVPTDPIKKSDVAVNTTISALTTKAQCCLTDSKEGFMTEIGAATLDQAVQKSTSNETKSFSGPSYRQVQCRWCKRAGHHDSRCWRKLRLCLICGGNHKLIECSKFVPTLFTPKCSLCSGSHLGKHCSKTKPVKLCCNWCGNTGHVETNCWKKNRLCLLCGSSDHGIRQCYKFVPRTTVLFPPWCSSCCDQHMPGDCASPYME